MATINISSTFFKFLLSLSCLLISSKKSYALEEELDVHHRYIIHLSSILPSPVCIPSNKANDRSSTLKVVHKHGPCFKPNGDRAKSPSHTEILLQDQARVNSIQSKLRKNSGHDEFKKTDAATIPAQYGSVVGSGNYIVTVGIGTPKKELSLIFDTGSDLTWTQCEPCVGHCYQQKETKFNPKASKTYRNISCSSTLCDEVTSATGNKFDCASSTCVYGIQYGDSSYSIGFFGKETLTLTSRDVIPNFLFGCGQDNDGLFGGAAGLLGLGRDQISLVSQTARKYIKLFSYCLPSSSSSTGYLTFGKGRGISKAVKFTPLSSLSEGTSFYVLDMTGITVGGQKLSIPTPVFSTTGTIIDSGTVITRLPPTAYSALRSAFRQQMSKYPMAPPFSILDTCYDFSNYTSIYFPTISLFFSGDVEVRVHETGILYAPSLSQVCLAFAGNRDDSDVAIFGNKQQHTLEVVYDVAGAKVGFAPGGCS